MYLKYTIDEITPLCLTKQMGRRLILWFLLSLDVESVKEKVDVNSPCKLHIWQNLCFLVGTG